MSRAIESLPTNTFEYSNKTPKVELMVEEIKTAFTIAKTIVGPDTDILLYAGKVRNLLLNKDTSMPDYDFIGDFNPDDVQARFPELVSDRWDDVSTIRLKIGNDDYDFTWADNIQDRLAIGDMTVSNICMDESGQIIDFFGGTEDLAMRKIRVINPDYKFNIDPSRILRVLRLSGELDFDIEEETLQSLIRNAPLLFQNPYIEDDLLKILCLEDELREKIIGEIYHLGINQYLSNHPETKQDSEARVLEKKIQRIKETDQIRELFDTNVYLVGGAVRDTIWGKRINDLDFKVFMPIEKMIKIIEKKGFVKSENYKTEPGQYYISSFPGVMGINTGGCDIHLSEASSPDINELIKEGDLNFNCCSYDIHTRRILNPEYIKEIKTKELRFANPELAQEDPTIIINSLSQISKLPEIIISEETGDIIKKSIPQVKNLLEKEPHLNYLLEAISTSINSEEAISYLGDYKEDILKNVRQKKLKLNVTSDGFRSEEVSKLSDLEKENIFEIIKKAYGEIFEPSKVFDGNSNSVVLQEKDGKITSCCIIDSERLYAAAAEDRLSWVQLVSEITKNNYNLWGTVQYGNTKIRALCSLAGLKLENNPKVIEKILKTKSHKYMNMRISDNEGTSIFRKEDGTEEKPQILMRS